MAHAFWLRDVRAKIFPVKLHNGTADIAVNAWLAQSEADGFSGLLAAESVYEVYTL